VYGQGKLDRRIISESVLMLWLKIIKISVCFSKLLLTEVGTLFSDTAYIVDTVWKQ